ncbi:hypothetical protein [Streptomyces sp. NBC_00564]|uniref:hypothetical protein n=1 Tax=Streptomyces sp. NBC_00564 TaxID=2903663 RepID=UPI00352DC5BD|nr:hypothetical protein OG256_01415 [Streptomyces sp. NBC_00564]
MRQRIDLDLAAALLVEHRARWTADQCVASPILWSGGKDAPPVADRSHVNVPHWLGSRITHAGWEVRLAVELDATGWAHLHFLSETAGVHERRRVRSLDRWDALLDQAVARASRIRLVHAQLVARACTTGWLDWIHGELWLLPTSLIRIRSGLMASVANSLGSNPTAPEPAHTIAHDPAAILAGHRTNKIIPFDGIERARLHGGITTSGMTVSMVDGTRHKLLWLTSEPTRRLLTDRLLPILGDRLTR